MKLIFQEVRHINETITNNSETQKNIKEIKIKLEEHEAKFKNIEQILKEYERIFKNDEMRSEILWENDYTQIILKDLESRINILEEESQKYEVN